MRYKIIKSKKYDNYIDIVIEELPSKVINCCIKRGIEIKNLYYKDSTYITINKRYAKSLNNMLIELNWRYRYIKKGGYNYHLSRNISRIGLIAGVFISIAILLISNYFTLRRIIIPNNYSAEISVIVESYKKGLFYDINDESLILIKKEIDAIDGIFSSNVIKRGMTIYIDVIEELDKDYYYDFTQNSSIISQYDAIITRIICLNGSAQVVMHQSVKKGDILIEGVKTLYENSIITYAAGEVYGRVFYNTKVKFYKNGIDRVLTGNNITINTIEFSRGIINNRPIEDIIAKKTDYKNYYIEESTIILKGVLPFTIKNNIIYEIELIEKEYTIIEAYEAIKEEALSSIRASINADYIPLNSSYYVNEYDNFYEFDVYLEVEQRIDLKN